MYTTSGKLSLFELSLAYLRARAFIYVCVTCFQLLSVNNSPKELIFSKDWLHFSRYTSFACSKCTFINFSKISFYSNYSNVCWAIIMTNKLLFIMEFVTLFLYMYSCFPGCIVFFQMFLFEIYYLTNCFYYYLVYCFNCFMSPF